MCETLLCEYQQLQRTPSSEFCFKGDLWDIYIGSKRLAEVFYNLMWIYNNQRDQFRIEEFRVYESLYRELRSIVPAPGIAWVAYEELKHALGETDSTEHLSEEK